MLPFVSARLLTSNPKLCGTPEARLRCLGDLRFVKPPAYCPLPPPHALRFTKRTCSPKRLPLPGTFPFARPPLILLDSEFQLDSQTQGLILKVRVLLLSSLIGLSLLGES